MKHTDEMLTERIKEMRRAGDARPLDDLLKDLNKGLTPAEIAAQLRSYQGTMVRRQLRGGCITNPDEVEVQFNLFTDTPSIRYRVPPIMRVMRDGVEDYIKGDLGTGAELNGYDSWNYLQNRIRTAQAKDRRDHNRTTSDQLVAIGLDPQTQTIHAMQSKDDPRICVLCGEKAILGDSWERDHETPVARSDGGGRLGWAHRSCNRAKGAAKVDHASVGI